MKVLIYLCLAIFCSCTTQNYSDELKNNFDQKEIADLEKMVHFFQEQMCNKKNDFELCIDSLTPILGEQGWNPILDNIDFEQQKKLYEDFQSNLFNEIWSFCKTSNPREGWVEESVCLNTQGKYASFLKDLGKRNEMLEYYYNSCMESGDFFSNTVLIESEIYTKTGRLDLNDLAIQSLIAIQYLTPNDQEKRRKNRVEVLDTLKVMDSCFVLLTPNITLIEKLKTEYGEEDFYTIADDNQYYLSDCRSYLEERGVKIIETSKRVVDFKIKDSNENYIVNSDSIGGWGVIMFNGVSRPYIANLVDIDYSIKEFRKQ